MYTSIITKNYYLQASYYNPANGPGITIKRFIKTLLCLTPKFSTKAVQKKSHRKDFGFKGNYNKKQAAKFEKEISYQVGSLLQKNSWIQNKVRQSHNYKDDNYDKCRFSI